ncbi:MAG TPA: response regulator [Steroidobacteraceae bacterium]|jgi:two-component system LytT family response regulator
MRVLIVDDEPLARHELRRLLADFAWLVVVGEAANIDEAARKVEELAPDLMFLDIHMPGGSGFDLLGKLERIPEVIFTTAYDQHAVRAFEVNALDYLLKPVEPERLAAALSRVERQEAATLHPETALEQLFVRDGERCWFVPLREVRLFSADGNFVRIHWGKLQPVLARPLTVLEQRLDPKQFFRANRSQIINVDFIESVELGVGGRMHVQLKDGPEIEISRRQARVFREKTTV